MDVPCTRNSLTKAKFNQTRDCMNVHGEEEIHWKGIPSKPYIILVYSTILGLFSVLPKCTLLAVVTPAVDVCAVPLEFTGREGLW